MALFAHICPGDPHLLDILVGDRSFHLTLAHLVETDKVYTKWYADKSSSAGVTNIMDNSAFEMYKQDRPMYPSDKLIEMGTEVNADYIVMSDYPAQHQSKTIDAAIEMAPQLREAGFGTFFVPQSEIGDIEGLVEAFKWAAESEHVDYIGVSILAVPNAYGVEKDNKLQRFLSRWKFLKLLDARGILDIIVDNGKMIHMLGMVDGPNEIELCAQYMDLVDTWDSSAAIWAGLHEITFDNSPSGLVDGKFEKEVNFDYKLVGMDSTRALNLVAACASNIYTIDNMMELTSERY
tara:strand:+ start:2994 stop:3869 length:876 start_codon:yes stop_codon:yes gene_type:complete